MANDHNKESRYRDGDMRLWNMRKADHPDGVTVDPVPITQGDEVTVLYYGLLSNAGADQVWLHTGYGDHDKWQAVHDYRMEKTGWGWAKTIQVNAGSRFNFCFKDSANNWDNNSGANWSFEVHTGKQV